MKYNNVELHRFTQKADHMEVDVLLYLFNSKVVKTKWPTPYIRFTPTRHMGGKHQDLLTLGICLTETTQSSQEVKVALKNYLNNKYNTAYEV